MIESFFKDKLAPLTLRLALGLVCIYHGFSKIMQLGGLNWNPSLPVGWQFAIAWGEFGCGLMILLGLRCRLAAAGVLAMIVGHLVHFEGWHVFKLPLSTLEPIVLLLLVGMTLLFLGAGELSLDARKGGSSGSSSSSRGSSKRRAA